MGPAVAETEELSDILRDLKEDVLVSIVPANELRDIYEARRVRWERTGIPVSSGMPEFVHALTERAGAKVGIGSVRGPRGTYVLLTTADARELIAAIAIEDPSDPPQ